MTKKSNTVGARGPGKKSTRTAARESKCGKMSREEIEDAISLVETACADIGPTTVRRRGRHGGVARLAPATTGRSRRKGARLETAAKTRPDAPPVADEVRAQRTASA